MLADIANALEEAWLLRYSQPDEALKLAEVALRNATASEDSAGIAYSSGMIAVCHFQLNLKESVFKNLETAIRWMESNPDHLWHARYLVFYANACQNAGKLPTAFKAIQKGILLAGKSGSPDLVADAWATQGMIYRNIHMYKEALGAFRNSLEIRRNLNDHRSVASSLNQMAFCHASAGEYNDALSHYSISEELRISKGFESDLGYTLLGKASVYEMSGEPKKAEDYYRRGLDLSARYQDRRLECHCKFGLGTVLMANGDCESAELFLKEALQISESINSNELSQKILIRLSDLQERLGYYAEALESLKNHLALRTRTRTIEALSSLHRETITLVNEIDASLRYASRIQNAILPSEGLLSAVFDSFFVVCQPFISGTIGGDFYFAVESRGLIFFAAADCTGHGIPGALMSMLGHSALRKAIIDEEIEFPGEILSFCQTYISELFSDISASGEVNDGMEIALCLYDKKRRKLSYATAGSTFYQLRGEELVEHKGSRASISRDSLAVGYDTYEIDYHHGDVIYMFSDGIRDQFGGPEGKKFGSRRLKELLLSVNKLGMEEQKSEIVSSINRWTGSEAQVDDMLLIGIKLLTDKP